MPPNNVEANGAPETKPASNGGTPTIPTWVNEKHFIDILRDTFPGFKKVKTFTRELTGGAGENYASIMLRVKVEVELDDGSVEDIAYVIKTIPQGEHGAEMVNSMDLFPKETTMYSTYLPEFEQMYRNVGKDVTFAPKFYTLKKNPGAEYILLEDLRPRDFKNVNRLDGLNKEHTESALRLLADLHAVSAARYELKGQYEEIFSTGIFSEKNRELMQTLFDSSKDVMLECFSKLNISEQCLNKVKVLTGEMLELMIQTGTADPNDFNVLNHGDLWANNIMFRHNDEGKLLETIFVDLQICRYGPPVVDLYYFLLSSTNLDLKLSHFDYFVKYYHDHLVENLKLLKYPKTIPSLKYLRMQLLKYNVMGLAAVAGIMAPVLLEPSTDANMESFVQEGEDGKQFRRTMYGNARYTKHVEAILPWMETRGLLDL